MSKGKTSGIFVITLLLIIGLFVLYLKIRPDPNQIHHKWQEETQLVDGNIVWITRAVSYERIKRGWIDALNDVASNRGFKNMELTIEIPETSFAAKPPLWRFNAVPLVVDYDQAKKTWVIIGGYFYCDTWEATGEPALNRWQYVVKDDQ